MSEKIEVEVFYKNSSVWIFQRPDRGYPSISIQGDSLALLATRLQLAVEQIKSGRWDEEVEYDLESVQDALSGLWTIYQEHGLRNTLLNPQDQSKKE